MKTLFDFIFYTIALLGMVLAFVIVAHGDLLNGLILLIVMTVAAIFHASYDLL